MMTILSTREWATIIWAVLLLAFVLRNRECRKGIRNVIKQFFAPKLRMVLKTRSLKSLRYLFSDSYRFLYNSNSYERSDCFAFLI